MLEMDKNITKNCRQIMFSNAMRIHGRIFRAKYLEFPFQKPLKLVYWSVGRYIIIKMHDNKMKLKFVGLR